jgi:hypothetical protein
VFGTGRDGWRPDLPDASHEAFIPLLWIRILDQMNQPGLASLADLV